jgi:predicted metal-dependent hydrolase
MAGDPTSVVVDGTELTVTVTRKPVKHINARLRGAHLSVSAPRRVSARELARIVPELARKLLRRSRAQQVNDEAEASDLARRVAARFPEPPQVTEVRFVTTQRRRYGSYSQRTGIVRLNVVLRQMPRSVLEGVLAHELAHAVHPDHSPAFWQLLRRVCPETDQVRAFLRGVEWLAAAWPQLPSMERSLLGFADDEPASPARE